jgi:aminocarboxymuconate-semialdehyde decarboxylase
MSLKTAKVIDVHAHAVLDEVMGKAGAYGPELAPEPDGTPVFRIGDYYLRNVRYRGSVFMEPNLRLEAMDAAGIDFQLLSPNPLTYFHYIPAKEATDFCRAHNDAMAQLVAYAPDRFAGLAALPIQDVDASIKELERSVEDLGLRGAMIGTEFPGGLDGEKMEELYACVTQLDVPLFIHPAPAGIDGPKGSEALTRYELDIMVGFTGQETVAVSTLIYSGILHRHPSLDICISHGGGALALVFGRLENAALKRPWAPDYLKEPGAFTHYAKQLWYDIHMHDDRAVDMLVDRVGTERLVYGTNFAGWDAPKTFHAPGCDAPLADNARRLLRCTV